MNNFPKIIPVFPLSNFIIFPNTTVPLNIFEPRYLDMVNDSMKSNKLIGMIQPKNSKDKNGGTKKDDNKDIYLYDERNIGACFYDFRKSVVEWKREKQFEKN